MTGRSPAIALAAILSWHTPLACQSDSAVDALIHRVELGDAGSRLPGQFRRWRLALADYRWDLDGTLGRGIADERLHSVPLGDPAESVVARWRATSRILDDRGTIVLRHGDPIRMPSIIGTEEIDGENLAWSTPTGRLIVGFARAPGSGRFGMVARNLPFGDPVVTCEFDADLCQLALPHFISVRVIIQHLVDKYYPQRMVAQNTDGSAETYSDTLGAVIQSYGIPRGGTLVVMAVPADRLVRNAKLRESQRQFAARIRVVIGDSVAGTILATLDTVHRWNIPDAVTPGTWFSTAFTVPVAPGVWSVSVVVGDTSHTAGTGSRFRAVPVVPFDGKALALSDPIVGRDSSGLTWPHNGDVIPLNPTNAWRLDEPVIASYAIDGMVPGRSYETHFELWQASGHPNEPSFTVGYTSQATQTTMAVQREFSPRNLAPGEYRLIVRVRDTVTHTEVARGRLVAIVK